MLKKNDEIVIEQNFTEQNTFKEYIYMYNLIRAI